MDVDSLGRAFGETYGRAAERLVRAPGRVNLIGEHTDYNDGFVLPIAIEKQIVAAVGRRDDRTVRLASRQVERAATVDLDRPITPGEPPWANYCKGVAAGLIERGVPLRGADILFDSDIPLGAGLSSSAALEVCTAMALLAGSDAMGAVPDRELALLCQAAENKYAAAPCGIMDQSICVMGQADRALLLDCRTAQTRQIPFDDPGKVLLVVDTRVRHDIGEGGYPRRRAQCESAARKLGLTALRDANESMLDAVSEKHLSDIELMRVRHVLGEIARTLSGADVLKAGDYSAFGRLMCESHTSLRDDFDVSCEELDAVVDIASSCQGVWGARMTGGGFGGSAIVLVETGRADPVARIIAEGFEKRFAHPCGIFPTRPARGAGILE